MQKRPIERRPYVRPQVTTHTGKQVGTRTRLIEFHPKIGGKLKRVLVKQGVSRKELEIIQKLAKARVRVEVPILHTGEIAVFKREGWMLQELKELIKKHPNKRIRASIATLITNSLGKAHALRISHGHPHDRNIVIDSQFKPTLIDFKLAKKHPELDWKSPESIRTAFKEDWKWWAETLDSLGYQVPRIQQFFEAMFKYYPCGQTVRKQLPKTLMNLLRREGIIHNPFSY
ncbi:MAG: hypothetical protein Q7S92_04710 [Candidatus Diapherotrites archaeon]|nr:hypothetical protein [Candidatus Diapherotrites archaeon]